MPLTFLIPILVAITWSIVLGSSLFWNIHNQKDQFNAMAHTEARANLNKDISFRRWATLHGGVYVPITETQKPIPWMDHLPKRDVVTEEGQALTLINPASMLRQMMELYAKDFGIIGRITGLKYLNPANQPDSWEKFHLERMALNKVAEVWEIADIEGEPHLRYLRPMYMEKRCEKCHAILGYKEGDLRGATGINLPLKPYLERLRIVQTNFIISHSIIWFLGLLGIGWSGYVNHRHHKERERQASELKRAEHRYHTLFDHARDGIAIIDPQLDQFIESNSSACKLLEYDENSFNALSFTSIDCKKSPLELNALIKKTLDQGIVNYETSLLTRLGGTRQVNIVLQRLSLESKIFILATFQDIGLQKEVEQALLIARNRAEQANRSKSDFLANMSHEIRTPMNAILGLTRLVFDSDIPLKQKEFLGKVLNSGQSLLRILNDILDYSKIEANRIDIDLQPFSVVKLVEEMRQLYQSEFSKKGLQFKFTVSPDIPNHLLGDGLRITQVLSNLISNAVKFTEKGEVRVAVSLKEGSSEHSLLEFMVEDSGVGLSEEQVKNLFTPFSQADNSVTRRYGGTGLGLSISRRLVKLMGGEISVSSHLGQGTHFCFSVKVEKIDAGSFLHGDLHQFRELHTLVVDDDPLALEIVLSYLHSWGVDATSSEDGYQALQMIERAHNENHPFDLLLIDFEMPGLNGVEVLQQIRKKESDQGYPNVVALLVTGHERDQLPAETRTTLNGVLHKPYTQSSLFDALMDAREYLATPQQTIQLYHPEQPLKGKRVLLAEDNLTNQLVAAEYLKSRGMIVTLANNGQEAVDLAERESFDAILMDLHMPVMDGLEATKEIRLQPSNHLTPIIALTAAVMETDREQCLEAGMTGFVAKPIEPQQLDDILQSEFILFASTVKESDAEQGSLPPVTPQELPLLDIHAVLSRLNHNQLLLQRLFQSFIQENKDIVAQLTREQISSEHKSQIKILHVLKGAAGNLGALKLSEACRDLEGIARSSGQNLPLESFSLILEETLKAMQDNIHQDSLQNGNDSSEESLKQLAQIITQLKPLLKNREILNETLQNKLYQLNTDIEIHSNYERLLDQLEQFNYDGAENTLQEIEQWMNARKDRKNDG